MSPKVRADILEKVREPNFLADILEKVREPNFLADILGKVEATKSYCISSPIFRKMFETPDFLAHISKKVGETKFSRRYFSDLLSRLDSLRLGHICHF